MSFTNLDVQQAFIRSGGICECIKQTHNHITGRCSNQVIWLNRGRYRAGAWEANHKNRVESGGHSGISNLEILCWPCHRETF